MAYFEWSNDIEIGHAEIDAQHKRLLALGEAVVEPLMNRDDHRPGAEPLGALIDFAEKHFAYEEGLMRSAEYPALAQHAKHHATLLTELRVYFSRVTRGENTNPAGMIGFLWNWVVLHIDSADRELVAWLRSRDAGSGPGTATAPTKSGSR